MQNGVVIQNSDTDIEGIDTTNSITDEFCEQQKSVFGDTDVFEEKGGLVAMVIYSFSPVILPLLPS